MRLLSYSIDGDHGFGLLTADGDGVIDLGRDATLLGTVDQMVQEHAQSLGVVGTEVPDACGQIVGTLELLDHDALVAEIVAPDALDELGVVDALDPDAARQRHLRRRRTKIDRTRSGEGRLRRRLVRRRSSKRDGPAIDHECTRPRHDRMVSTVAVTNDDLLGLERDDRPDPTRGSMLDNHTHRCGDRRIVRSLVPRTIEVDRFRKNAVLHGPNATTLWRTDRGTPTDVWGLSPNVRRLFGATRIGPERPVGEADKSGEWAKGRAD